MPVGENLFSDKKNELVFCLILRFVKAFKK